MALCRRRRETNSRQSETEKESKWHAQQRIKELTGKLPRKQSVDTDTKHWQTLLERAKQCCHLAEEIRNLPAEESESNALVGTDPVSLARLASKDAERAEVAMREPPAEVYTVLSRCLDIADQRSDAEEALLRGLAAFPCDPSLQSKLAEVQDSFPNAGGPRKLPRRGEEFDCVLCLKLLLEPVTTGCGHSFCKECLKRAIDHRPCCPVCRSSLLVSAADAPVSVTLKSVIERSFPEEIASRRRIEQVGSNGVSGDCTGSGASCAGAGAMRDECHSIALFVLTDMLPGMRMCLNIFEPRYRLMVRRLMEGSRRFGMVHKKNQAATSSSARGEASSDAQQQHIATVGCEVEIVECEPLHDGRYYLEVVGRRRWRRHELGEQDGYRTAQVTFMADRPSGEDGHSNPSGEENGDTVTGRNANGGSDSIWTECGSARNELGRHTCGTASAQSTIDRAEKLSQWVTEKMQREMAGGEYKERMFRSGGRPKIEQRGGGSEAMERSAHEMSWFVSSLVCTNEEDIESFLRLDSAKERIDLAEAMWSQRINPATCS